MLDPLDTRAVLSDEDCLLLCEALVIDQVIVEVYETFAGQLALYQDKPLVEKLRHQGRLISQVLAQP